MVLDPTSVNNLSSPNEIIPAVKDAASVSWFHKGVKVTAWAAAIGTTLAVSATVAYLTRANINAWVPKLILDYTLENSERLGREFLLKSSYFPSKAIEYMPSSVFTAVGGGVVGPTFCEMSRPFVEYGAYAAAGITGSLTAKVMTFTFNKIANFISPSEQNQNIETVEKIKENTIIESVKPVVADTKMVVNGETTETTKIESDKPVIADAEVIMNAETTENIKAEALLPVEDKNKDLEIEIIASPEMTAETNITLPKKEKEIVGNDKLVQEEVINLLPSEESAERAGLDVFMNFPKAKPSVSLKEFERAER